MFRLALLLVFFLLGFTGLTATLSGGLLLLDPTGTVLGLSTALFWSTPLTSFAVPGALLLGTVGLSSFWLLTRLLRRDARVPRLVMAQGAVLYAWVLAEMGLVRQAHPLQLLVAGAGIALFELGAFLLRRTPLETLGG